MTTPEPCDCCHGTDPAWTPIPVTPDLGELADPQLTGRTARVLAHMLGQDGRLHLAETIRGTYLQPVRREGSDEVGIALHLDGEPEAALVGPLTDRHIVQVATPGFEPAA